MKTAIYEWLKVTLCTEGEVDSEFSVENMLKDEKATAYLLVWPLMEKKLFDGFLTSDKIESFGSKNKELYRKLNVDEISKHFYDRYQNKNNFRHLINRSQNDKKYHIEIKLENILDTEYESLQDEDKLNLLLIVCYRYRNNIFHGSKGIQSWSKYGEQIEYCITFMMRLIDEYEKSLKVLK